VGDDYCGNCEFAHAADTHRASLARKELARVFATATYEPTICSHGLLLSIPCDKCKAASASSHPIDVLALLKKFASRAADSYGNCIPINDSFSKEEQDFLFKHCAGDVNTPII
jgi:hypothetical protein